MVKLLSKCVRLTLGYMTPHEQMTYLRETKDFKAWERFRDSLLRMWSNLNVIVSPCFQIPGMRSRSDSPSTEWFDYGVNASHLLYDLVLNKMQRRFDRRLRGFPLDGRFLHSRDHLPVDQSDCDRVWCWPYLCTRRRAWNFAECTGVFIFEYS